MTSVPHHRQHGRMVLVVADQPNSRETAKRSEVLAMGIALQIAIRSYNVAYPYWAATEGLQAFDLSATDEAGNEFHVEARGRIDRTNKGRAVQQVYDKFEHANFSHAAGVIFFPRTNKRGREDIIVLDPEGESERHMANSRYRNLLMHYVPIFIAQGALVRPFGERLKALSASPDRVFSSYLKGGDPALSSPATHRGRSGFRWNGTLYIGAFFKDIAWPIWLTRIERPLEGGVFFWGIAEEVIRVFQRGQLASLEFAASEQPVVSRTERVMSIVMPDRTLLIWAETMRELTAAEDSHVSKLHGERTPTEWDLQISADASFSTNRTKQNHKSARCTILSLGELRCSIGNQKWLVERDAGQGFSSALLLDHGVLGSCPRTARGDDPPGSRR